MHCLKGEGGVKAYQDGLDHFFPTFARRCKGQQESVSKGMVTLIIYLEQIDIHPSIVNSIDGFHIAPLFIHYSEG